MNPCDLATLMLGHGWKLHVEDYDHSMFTCMMRPHTNRGTLINLLTLAGYDVYDPDGYVVSRFIYVYHPNNPSL